jgi:hypothetical protein
MAFGDFVGKFGSTGSGNGQFIQSQGVCVDDDFIYVADKQNLRIQIFNKTAPYAFVAKFTSGKPIGVMVDSNYIYTSDQVGKTVRVHNKTSPYAEVDTFGTFANPYGIAVDDDRIFVSDYTGNDVKVYDKATYDLITNVGAYGSGDGRFQNATGIDIDDNYIYVGDYVGSRIQIFDKTTYAFVDKIPLQFYALGVAVDSGHIYGCSYAYKIESFDKTTYAPTGEFGSQGSGDGQFNAPYQMIVDGGLLYNSEHVNNRIQISGAFEEPEPPAVVGRGAIGRSIGRAIGRSI